MGGGYMGDYLDVDLGTGRIDRFRPREEDRTLYLGGRGLGTRLLYDLSPPGLDPFDPRMPLIFSTGPLTGTHAPQSNRFTVTTKSPLTGGLGDSHCGGHFAGKLKLAGYDGVIVRGRSERPVYLEITESGAALRDAGDLWGKGTAETQAALPKSFGKAVIGPAGERRVRFAAIASGHRFAGRCGTGAVMGAKQLKAVIADGRTPVPVADPEGYAALRKEITRFLLAHPLTGGPLKEQGTANLVMTTAGRNLLPVRNFQAGQDPEAWRLSGHRMRSDLLVRGDGCLDCPIRCGRHVRVRGREGKGPEYETIGLLGSNLGIFSLEDVVELGQLCDDLGLDTISMGGVLGFATELTARGLLSSDLRWGDVAAYRRAIEATACREGLGDALAEGSARLAERHGGRGFAMQVKGLELPAYDPRGVVGQALEYAVTARGGCHIRGSTMFLEATGPVSIDPLSPRAKPELVVFQQNTNASISSLHMCIFSAYAVIPEAVFRLDPNGLPYRAAMGLLKYAGGPVVGLLLRMKNPSQVLWFEKFLSRVIGRTVGMGELDEIGARICNLERLYNLREGKTAADDTLPARALEEPLSPQMNRPLPLTEMLARYYRVRGWDPQGVPRPETLERLRIRR